MKIWSQICGKIAMLVHKVTFKKTQKSKNTSNFKPSKRTFTKQFSLQSYSIETHPLSLTWVPQSKLAFGHYCRLDWLLGLWPSAITILQCAAPLAACHCHHISLIVGPYANSSKVSYNYYTSNCFKILLWLFFFNYVFEYFFGAFLVLLE